MARAKLGRYQFTVGTLLTLTALCALVFGLLRYVVKDRDDAAMDSYTGLQLAAMMTAYLDANGDAWPRSWDDLRSCEEAGRRIGGPREFSFDEIQQRWGIDFEADPVQLVQVVVSNEGPPIEVLRQRYTRPLKYRQYEPNLRVYWRLQSHAALQTAGMVIEHLKAHGNAWPKNWDDLRQSYAAATRERGGHWCSFEQARACMDVDFTVDVAELARAEAKDNERPFEVIYQRRGLTPEGGDDPNRKVFEYLKKHWGR